MFKTIVVASLFLCMFGLQSLKAFNQRCMVYNQRDGLAANTIDAITQDEEGYLYFATNRGLSIFDGSSFLTYNYYNTKGFSNSLTSLVMLDCSHLLIGSRDKGLFLFDKWTDTIEPLSFKSVTLSHITTIHVTKQKELWIATLNEGLFYIGDYSELLKSPQSMVKPIKVTYPFPFIYQLLSIGDDLFVASHGNTLFRISRTDHSFAIDKSLIASSVSSLNSLLTVDSKELWVGSNEGLFILKKQARSGWSINKRITLLSSPIRSLNRIANTVYAALEGGGMFEIDLHSHRVKPAVGVEAKSLISSFVANDHSLWIGSWNEGLCHLIFSDPFFNEVTYAVDNHRKNMIWGVHQIDSLNSCLMTNGMGLCVFHKQKKEIQTLSDDYPYIFSMCPKTNSSLWYVGTWGNGLKMFDLKKQRYVNSSVFDELNHCRILSIDYGAPGQLLISAYPQGAYVFDESSDKLSKLELPATFGEMNIRRFIPMGVPNTYWMATFNAGLFKIGLSPQGHLVNFEKVVSAENNSLQIENVISEDNRLWLCLSDGLAYIDLKSTPFRIQREVLLDGCCVKAIKKMDKGKYFLATLSGLIYLDVANQSIKRFFTDESLYSLDLSENRSTLLVGGANYLITCRTAPLLKRASEGKAVIRLLRVNGVVIKPNLLPQSGYDYVNKSINYTDTLLLPAGKQTLSFSLSSLMFEPIVDHVFYYKMDGVDKTWNQVLGKSATAIYNSLPAGVYRLHIRINDLNSLEGEKTLLIIKSDYWFNLWWVRLLILVILVGAASALILSDYRRRMRRKIVNLKAEQEEELYQQKMRFFTNMSHDLKTPLTLLLTPLQDMVEHVQMPEMFKERLASMIMNGDQLLNRINKILDYKDALPSDGSLHYEAYPIGQLIYDLVMPFKEYAQKQGLDFQFEVDGTEYNEMVYTDYGKISSIFENLISNAIKYTPEGGQVKVDYVVEGEDLIFRVEDTGIGIADDKKMLVYNRYFRITDDDKGVGIGLCVVKNYVELLGGEIEMKSEVGHGTAFLVRLPMRWADEKTDSTEASGDKDKAVPEQDRRATIIIVDDNKEMRDYLVEAFEPFYEVLSAANGRPALELIKNEIPDLVISDLMMPDIDGLELCRTLKSNLLTSHIPFVLLSANGSPEMRMQGWKAEVDLFEIKPFNKKLLLIKVANLLKNRKQMKYKYQMQMHSFAQLETESTTESLEDKFMRTVNETIEKCADLPDLSVEDLAKKMAMNHDQLYRKVKALTGISVNQYIRSYRLNKAASLLRSKKYTVTEVLYRVGFNNPSYFTKCFKKEFGVSPSEYLLNIDEKG